MDGQQSENRFPPVQLSDVCTERLSCFQSEDRALGRACQTSSPQCNTSLNLSFAQRLFGVLFIVAFHPPRFTARLNHRPAPLIAPFETGPFVPWLSTSDLNSFILDTGEHILEFSIISYLGSEQLPPALEIIFPPRHATATSAMISVRRTWLLGVVVSLISCTISTPTALSVTPSLQWYVNVSLIEDA